MSPFDLLIHLLNFAAPAMGMAVLMLGLTWVLNRKRPLDGSAWVQIAVNFGVGLIVMCLGLWIFGRDGTMATYGALVFGLATSQWVINKSWRN